MTTQILVTKPKTLTVSDKKKLREAGIVCVEAEAPEEVRLLSAESPPLGGNDLLFAAMSAMAHTPNGNSARDTKIAFADIVAKLLEQARQ